MNSVDELKSNIINKPITSSDLTEEDKTKLLAMWNSNPENPPGLLEMAKAVGKNSKVVRKFLATRQLKSELTNPVYALPKDTNKKFELLDEHKEFIRNNYLNTKNSLDLCRTLFNNKELTFKDIQVKIVNKFIKEEIDPNAFVKKNQDTINTDEWTPPDEIEQVMKKVNQYTRKTFIFTKLTAREKNNFYALLGYLSTFRFIHHINTYEKKIDRDLFESEFIRCTYDKNDLTQEEIDQYIIYSTEVVISKSILKRMEDFSKEQDDILCKEDGKLSLALVDATSSLRTEYNQCVKRQRDLLDDLTQKRSERIVEQRKNNESALTWFNAWKNEDTRLQMIKVANKRKEELSKEADKLDNMDELKCRILGVDKNLLIDG